MLHVASISLLQNALPGVTLLRIVIVVRLPFWTGRIIREYASIQRVFRLAIAVPSLACRTQCLKMLRFLSALPFYLRL